LNPDQQENINLIQTGGEHLLTLINDVLDLSKIEAGRTTVNPISFDLHQLLGDLREVFSLRVEDKKLQLLLELQPNVPQYVRTDPLKLRQILMNLIGNAIKFTPEGGISVRVRATEVASGDLKTGNATPQRLHFEVEDTGLGIAPEEFDSLFEPFVQTSTGRQSQEGTGLGLPISRKFIELMGGQLTVKSDVGRGSIFAFNILVDVVAASELPSSPPRYTVMRLAPGQLSYRILVVDDNPTNRLLLVKLLTSAGFEVRQAENGQDALQIWKEWRPHLIWMDMRMPIMDGYETTRHIKATTQGQATVVVALTASTHEEERAIVLSAGCDDFMRKPFKKSTLFEVIQKHLGVIYQYENCDPLPQPMVDSSLDLKTLLALMPPSWFRELHQAAIDADVESTRSWIMQIPESQASTTQVLTNWVDGFRFDKITDLTEAAARG
jgi:two-component system sensor histidine kinase/response regulator